jgi:hypothetical protein
VAAARAQAFLKSKHDYYKRLGNNMDNFVVASIPNVIPGSLPTSGLSSPRDEAMLVGMVAEGGANGSVISETQIKSSYVANLIKRRDQKF